jgi:sugar phosphate isomerase/epimerase
MMSRTVRFQIGIDGAFATRRWERPESIVRLAVETGYRALEYCADLIDPFFMGPKEFVLEMAREVRECAARYGVTITNVYTGMATHRFHGFSHSRPEPGERMKQWLYECWDICLAMGTDRWGGHVDAVPVEILEDPAAYRARVERLYDTWRALARVAKDKGMGALYVEQMYIPSEVPWTLQQAEEMLRAVNTANQGCPVYLTVDVGHAAQMHYGLSGPDCDYREWLRRFGPWSEVVHLQQTTPDASAHWPFTEHYNQIGHIRMEEVVQALIEGHQQALNSPLAQVLPPVDHNWLILELIPPSTKNEATLIEEMRLSAEYLYRYVPPEGMTVTV